MPHSLQRSSSLNPELDAIYANTVPYHVVMKQKLTDDHGALLESAGFDQDAYVKAGETL